MDHELILTGPVPYFSAPEIFLGKCTCGTWESGKDFTEHSVRKRHAEHTKAKEANGPQATSGTYDSNYERQL